MFDSHGSASVPPDVSTRCQSARQVWFRWQRSFRRAVGSVPEAPYGLEDRSSVHGSGTAVSDLPRTFSVRASPGQRWADAWAFWILLVGLVWFGYSVNLPARPQELIRAEAAFGIRVEAVRLAPGGQLLDFRYRVLDSGKASHLLGPGTRAYLMTDKASAPIEAVEMSPDRSQHVGEDRGTVNVASFGNPGKSIKRGDRVTLILGRFKATGLTVQ